ncbi:MAG TPA: inositol monophosphatase family protein [Solirubrobacteraceae bacterium]|nr:inositol monophosphatase family protein [Solirubrobacteraceae bacterium]
MHADPDDLTLALELADLADSITLEHFRASDLEVATKPDLTPVTEADTAVERTIRGRLESLRPRDGVLGEEYGDSGSGARRWIIDPIDGTMSYVRGLPFWATLLALEDGGEVSVGVVSAPALHRRWWAARGGGAWLNDGLAVAPRRIHVSAVADLADAHLCLSAATEWEAIGRLDAILELERRCWRTRGYGDLWSYMFVAEGVLEIGLDPKASVWDLAAMQVVVEEAGGRFSDLAGTARLDGGNAVATNGLVHDAVLEILGG